MRRNFIKLFIVGLLSAVVGSAYAQAPSFSDVAGKWEGTGPSGKIELGIEPTGAFSIVAPRGTDSGVAKLEGGQIVMTFSKNPGSVKVSKNGDALHGTVNVGANSFPITFSRKK